MAGALNRIVGAWHGARITPMFGRWGYFVGDQLFGCFPIRAKDHDLWVRLSPSDQARALASTGIRPHRRFAARGWVECDVTEPAELPQALKWLRRAYEHLRRQFAHS
ncbi:MAG: luciferase family protein [bacterium]